MSTLTLVRHGQAHPFQREGAALTETGEGQAALLAQWWLRQGVRFDDVYTGGLKRQIQTEQIAAKCFSEAGVSWPQAVCDPSWNEYDAPGVLGRMLPRDERLSALAAEFEQARGGPEERRRFQRMFEAAMSCWIEGSIDCEGVEPWPVFRDRVAGAIGRLMAGPASRRVVVFTSGGAIGCAVQFAMKAPPRSFLEINWRIRNTAVSEFVYDRDRITVDSVNSIAHLADSAMRTYR